MPPSDPPFACLNTTTGGAFVLPRDPKHEERRGAEVPERYTRAAGQHLYNIVDIAIALGHQARYAGHTRRHYSVAEHSLLVAEIVLAHLDTSETRRNIINTLAEAHGPGSVDGLVMPEGKSLDEVRKAAVQYALLHDAAEAYCTDVPWPLMMAGLAPELQLFDRAVSDAIVRQFMGGWPAIGIKRLVKYVDVELIDIESEWVLYKRHPLWESRITASETALNAWKASVLFGEWKVSGGHAKPALNFLHACHNVGLATADDIKRGWDVIAGYHALTELELVLTSQQQSQGTVTAAEQGRVVLVLDEKAPTLRPYDRVEVRRV